MQSYPSINGKRKLKSARINLSDKTVRFESGAKFGSENRLILNLFD